MSSLLSLPWEIREEIWIYALRRDVPVRRPRVVAQYELNRPTKIRKEILRDNVASVLCTCRQAEEEAASIFYGMNDISPYFSWYVDQADYKADAAWIHGVPSSREWAALSEATKYQVLGLSAKYVKYIVSLVIYNDGIKGLASDSALSSYPIPRNLSGCNESHTSDLLAEMLFWVRLKAPQIQYLSVRYRLYANFQFLRNNIESSLAALSRFEPRFWRAAKRFPSMNSLELCISYAKPRTPREWGTTRPLDLIEEGDPILVTIRTKFLGPHLLHAFNGRWVELDPSEQGALQCGIRWVFVIQPKKKSHIRNRNSIALLRQKANIAIGRMRYISSAADVDFDRLGRSWENPIAGILQTSSDQALVDPVTLASMEECEDTFKIEDTLWMRIQSLPLSLKSRIWSFTLRRELPLHYRYNGNGNPLIAALLRVNRQTYKESRLLFLQVNTFSINPLRLPNPFPPSILRDDAFTKLMESMWTLPADLCPRPGTSIRDELGALRSLRLYMAHRAEPYHPSPLSLARQLSADESTVQNVLGFLKTSAPLLQDLNITHYTEQFREPNGTSQWQWHHHMMDRICEFQHLRRFILLTCLEKSMLIGVPWQQRLAELGSSAAYVTCHRTSDTLKNSVPHAVLPSGLGFVDPRLPRDLVRNDIGQILQPLGSRWVTIRMDFWPVEDVGIWDGTAWTVDLVPICPLTQEGHVCQA